MPSITLYTSAGHRLDNDDFMQFSASLAQITKEILKAKENNIHITCLTAEINVGTPVYLEAKLRQEDFRNQLVLNEFLSEVDLLINKYFGIFARIRCFLYGTEQIFARN